MRSRLITLATQAIDRLGFFGRPNLFFGESHMCGGNSNVYLGITLLDRPDVAQFGGFSAYN